MFEPISPVSLPISFSEPRANPRCKLESSASASSSQSCIGELKSTVSVSASQSASVSASQSASLSASQSACGASQSASVSSSESASVSSVFNQRSGKLKRTASLSTSESASVSFQPICFRSSSQSASASASQSASVKRRTKTNQDSLCLVVTV